MKIASIIPTLNRPDFLEKAILSIHKQKLKPNEVFIVDNNKKHNTNYNLFIKLKKKTDLKLVYVQNYSTIQSLRNDTVLKTDCEIISFLDDDDQWHESYLEKSLDIIKSTKVKAIYTSLEVIDLEKKKLSEIVLKKDYDIKKLLIFNPGFFHSNLIICKKTFLELNGFQSNSGASDKDFFIKLKTNNINFFINPEKLVYRCDHKHQWSKDYKKMSTDKFLFLRNNFKKLNLIETYQSLKNIIKFYLKYLKSLL